MIQRLYLILKEALGARFISPIVLLSVCLSVFAVGLYRIIGDNLDNYVRNRFASSIPPNTIRVSTRQPRSAFLFEVDRPAVNTIGKRQIGLIRNLDGVTEIEPVSALGIPLQARVTYLGFRYRSDILAFGVPYGMVKNELKGDRYRRLWNRPDIDRVVPVLIPRAILESYNDGMAASNGLPRISERGAVGFGFRLLLGKSSLKSLEGNEETDALIAGFTNQVDALALIVPLEFAERYNRKFNPAYRSEYQYAYVRVKDHPSLIGVSEKIKKMGLVVEADKGVSGQIMKLKEAVALIIRSLQAVIVIIAFIAISFATVIATLNRVEYYRTLRVIGASRLFLTATVLVKYAFLGLAGSWCGMMLLQYVAGRFAQYFQLTGIVISAVMTGEARHSYFLYGALVPTLSTLPALVRMYFKGLSGD